MNLIEIVELSELESKPVPGAIVALLMVGDLSKKRLVRVHPDHPLYTTLLYEDFQTMKTEQLIDLRDQVRQHHAQVPIWWSYLTAEIGRRGINT